VATAAKTGDRLHLDRFEPGLHRQLEPGWIRESHQQKVQAESFLERPARDVGRGGHISIGDFGKMSLNAERTLGPFSAFAEAVRIDCNVGLAVEKLLFTVGTCLAFQVWNRHDTGPDSRPENFPHAPDTPAAATRTARQGRCSHVDRLAETRI
jgi:hypothetical protein